MGWTVGFSDPFQRGDALAQLRSSPWALRGPAESQQDSGAMSGMALAPRANVTLGATSERHRAVLGYLYHRTLIIKLNLLPLSFLLKIRHVLIFPGSDLPKPPHSSLAESCLVEITVRDDELFLP